MHTRVSYFRHSTTGCADSAFSGVKVLYHAVKNAITSVTCAISTVNCDVLSVTTIILLQRIMTEFNFNNPGAPGNTKQ